MPGGEGRRLVAPQAGPEVRGRPFRRRLQVQGHAGASGEVGPAGGTSRLRRRPTQFAVFVQDFSLETFGGPVFAALRASLGITEDEYLQSLCSESCYLQFISNSKSKADFFLTNDKRFFLKTQNKREIKFLLSNLKIYVEHLRKFPHSLLVKFLGVHRIRIPPGRKKYFIVMQSVFYPDERISARYDIKGCQVSRWTDPAPDGSQIIVVLKDLNFEGQFITLGEEEEQGGRCSAPPAGHAENRFYPPEPTQSSLKRPAGFRAAALLAPPAGGDRHRLPGAAQRPGLQPPAGPAAAAPRRAEPEPVLRLAHRQNQEVREPRVQSDPRRSPGSGSGRRRRRTVAGTGLGLDVVAGPRRLDPDESAGRRSRRRPARRPGLPGPEPAAAAEPEEPAARHRRAAAAILHRHHRRFHRLRPEEAAGASVEAPEASWPLLLHRQPAGVRRPAAAVGGEPQRVGPGPEPLDRSHWTGTTGLDRGHSE
ncbi:uncharacterized protein LOC103474111 isoform X1 [Poecilia reticulata]|uniref:uncharacterized protein LOC103474111 isoform X1 n=1 Tax=Poecilia reticulata TaxID=8081 RepID=UPI0007EA0020|nr:PREDICTED: phosphatidylinositol 4-phosphate 5-kinase-like protein 1 isoform X1 [Poecilia reticulata]